MPLVDDAGKSYSNLPARGKAKPKTKKTTTSSSSLSTLSDLFADQPRYAKPASNSSLPGWAKEIRESSNFMPMRIKPASYTAMAAAEGLSGSVFRPQAYQPVTVPTPAPTNTLTAGGTYFKPTEEVTKGIKQEFNLWQDIKNLGGKIVHKGGSLLMGALDVLARPKYALMNVYKDKLERHYTTPESSGGADVTGGEAFKAFLGMLTPAGTIKDVVSGDFDDTVKAAVSGFTGKSKVFAKDIMEVTNPEFTKAHPLGSSILGIGLDITFDPLTWLTMGINPGSIGRAGVSGAKLAMGDKIAAQRLWSETLFTSTGRSAGLKTVSKHIKMKEINRLERKQGRNSRKTARAVKKGNTDKEQALRSKSNIIVADLAAKRAEDLKGAELGWKIFKKSLPTAGIMTASRFNTGAGGATAIKGAALLTKLHADFNWGVAENLSSEQRWQAMFAANKGRDFNYTAGGIKHTVKFSEDKNVKDFIFRFAKEANPVASYAEHGTVAARARKGHIIAVEARSNMFTTKYGEHIDDSLHKVLSQKESLEYGKVQGLARAKAGLKKDNKTATDKDLDNDRLLTLKEEDFDSPDLTYENLRDQAKAKWSEGKSKNIKAFDEDKVYVLYEGASGTKKVRLSTLKKAAESEEFTRAARLDEKARIAGRTPRQKSVDQLTGVSDGVAAGRARLIEAGNRVRVNRELSAANNESKAAHQALHRSVVKSIDDSDEFTAAEKTRYLEIIRDTSKPIEDRIAAILKEHSISNTEANEILEDTFKVTIDSVGNIHLPRGGTLEDIPAIIQAVIKDRFQHRITGSELENAGTTLKTNADGSVQVVQKAPEEGVVNFQRDVNAELGMMVLDGYRAAARYAVDNDLHQDPEALFNTIHKTTSEFMDMATADTKRQVIQTMFNMTGMRLPEKFVPSHTDVIKLIANKEHKFTNSATGKPLPNQQIPWENLGVRMQTWVTDLFNFAPKNKQSDIVRSGYNMEDVKKAVQTKSDDYDKPAPDSIPDEDLAKFNLLLDKIETLHDRVSEYAINGTTGAVNRYSFLDFLLHSDEIVKAQGTTTHVAESSKGAFGRVNTGRLSALDSFTFVDDETKLALNALTDLKEMSKSSNVELRNLAQESIAAMFVDAGGMKLIDNLTMPPSGSLADANFGEVFSTLGAHARLKESTLRKGKGILTGHSVQLLDSMWGKVTVNHELQKAFQNAILHKVWVKGQKEAIVAEDLAKNIDEFFAPFDNIKNALYPVRSEAGLPNAPKAMLQKDLQYTDAAPTGKTPTAAPVDPAKVQELNDAKLRLKAAILEAQKQPKLIKGTTAEGKLAEARQDYVDLLKAHDSAAKPVEPVVTPPEAVSADFVNNADVDYTPEEIEAIRDWIGITETMNQPNQVALQLHAFSNAITSDVILAQQQMISNMADLTIKYGAQVRFMGIPFMPMFNPMNATHTMAGVVAFDQYRGSPNKFLLNVVNKFKGWEKGQDMHLRYSRPSQIFEGSLERVRMDVVNRVSEDRKLVIKQLDDWYEGALATQFDNLPQLNGMSRKNKLKHFKESFFKTTPKGVADPIDQYKLPDGTNTLNDISVNFGDTASKVFTSKATVKGNVSRSRKDQMETFNRFMIKEYRLTGGEVKTILDHALVDSEFREMVPYSREWLRYVGEFLPNSKLNTDKLLRTNLGKLHYAIQDARLKYESGRALNHGVFEQFAFKMDAATAAMHNNKVVGATTGVDNKPLRNKMIPISDNTIGSATPWGIDLRHIPDEFLDQGYYISADILPEVNTMFKYMDGLSELNETINTGFLRTILNYFKASVTIYKVPSYPVRNLIGDVFMSAFDGLVNPRYYKDSARLLMDHHQGMKQIDTEAYKGIFDDSFLKKETLKAAHDPASVLNPSNLPKTPFSLHLETAEGPVSLNGNQVVEAYYRLGIGQNRVSGEIAESMKGARQSKLGVAGGRVHDLLRNSNDVREDWARMSHFLYALEREAPLGGGFEEVFRRASARVIKNHFDYNDVSMFERQVLAPFLPFYKWVRNVIPYTIATVITKPVALKAESATQAVIGHLIDDDHNDNRVDFVMPEWLEYDSPVSIGMFTDDNNNEFGQYMSLSMPLSDTLKRTIGPVVNPIIDPTRETVGAKALAAGSGVGSVIGSMTNPIVKGGIQAATGMEMWPTGPAPEKGNWAKTMGSAVPGSANIDALFAGIKGFQGINGQNLTAYWLEQLGAINMSNNTERAQLGELNKREDLYRGQFNKAKTNLSNLIQKKYPNTTPDQRKELVDAIVKESRKDPNSGRL
jgi:hypothetical protein